MIPFILAAGTGTDVSIPLDVVLWTGGIALALIGALVTIIYRSVMNAVHGANTKATKLEEKFNTDSKALEEKIVAKLIIETAKVDNRVEALSSRTHVDVNTIHARIETERTERIAKHDEVARRFGDDLEKTKEKVNDVSETVAGIGSVYLTRNEFTQFQTSRKT